MALVEVDRKTVSISVEAPVGPKGSIVDFLYYVQATNEFQIAKPTITQGQDAGLAVYAKNTGTQNQRMRVDLILTDPTGSIEKRQGNVLEAVPGEEISPMFIWKCEKAGTYQAELVLLAEVM